VVNLDFLGPFQVVKPPLTLFPKDTKPAAGSEKDGPVGWWKLDETSGSTVANAAGNKLNGHLFGEPRWALGSGARGGALEFDGKRNWIEFADAGDFDFRSGVTIAVWVKPRAVAKTTETLLAKGDAWRLQRGGGRGTLEFLLSGPQLSGANKGKPPRIEFKQSIEDNQWHHVVGSYDGKRIALYVDGEEKETVAASGVLALKNVPITLGENEESPGRLLNGWLNDVRLYARGLSAEEVKTLFREGATETAAK